MIPFCKFRASTFERGHTKAFHLPEEVAEVVVLSGRRPEGEGDDDRPPDPGEWLDEGRPPPRDRYRGTGWPVIRQEHRKKSCTEGGKTAVG